MPCRGPSDAECRTASHYADVADNLIYFFNQLKLWDRVTKEFHDGVKAVANSDGWTHNGPTLDDITAELCDAIQSVSIHDAHGIIYNGRSKKARQLADWWDDHQEEDAQREREEKEESERRHLIEQLTPRQRKLLGVEL